MTCVVRSWLFIPGIKLTVILQPVPCRLCKAGAVRVPQWSAWSSSFCFAAGEHITCTLLWSTLLLNCRGFLEDNPWIIGMKMWFCLPGVLWEWVQCEAFRCCCSGGHGKPWTRWAHESMAETEPEQELQCVSRCKIRGELDSSGDRRVI